MFIRLGENVKILLCLFLSDKKMNFLHGNVNTMYESFAVL